MAPFRGDTTATPFLSVVQAPHDPVVHLRPDLPEQLQQVIYHCLAKDREKPYQHAGEVLQDLRQLQLVSKGGADSTVVTEKDSPGEAKVEERSA